jgi:DNA segregation ATPase FtsK/SpoIIIE-like protein
VKKQKQDKKKEVTVEQEFVTTLKCVLTEAELLEQGKLMAEAQQEAALLDADFAAVKKQFTAKIDEAMAKASRAGSMIINKFDFRPVKCVRRKYYRAGRLTETRTDTGEQFTNRELTDDEKQLSFPEVVKAEAPKPVESTPPAATEPAAVLPEQIAQAVEILRATNRASTSSIQRRMKVGYTLACRIMDVLEEQGIVGPPRGSEPREIINLPDAASDTKPA